MNENLHIWRVWARFLQQWGMREVVAAILEATCPLTVMGAQFLYLVQPLMSGFLPEDHFSAASRLLEDTSITRDFVKFLREASFS